MSKRLTLGVGTWLHLSRIVTKIGRRLSVHLEQYNLTPAQFDVLAQLQAAPGISQQMLANRLFVTKGNVVGLLDRMGRCGLVERRTHPEDGRMHVLSLTQQGAELAAQVVPEHEALIAACLASITPEDQHSLHRLLRTLDHALGPL